LELAIVLALKVIVYMYMYIPHRNELANSNSEYRMVLYTINNCFPVDQMTNTVLDWYYNANVFIGKSKCTHDLSAHINSNEDI
jgi:hypothetical protein